MIPNLHKLVHEEYPKVIPHGWAKIPYANGGAIGYPLISGMTVLYSRSRLEDNSWWKHISLSRQDRYPDWDEMLKYLRQCAFLDHKKEIIMVIPPDKEYVNLNPNCFHFWQED